MFDKATPPTYRVMHASMPLIVESEDAFVALFGACDTAFWLDSSLLVPGLSRWSFMGAMAAPDDYLCRFDAVGQTLEITRPGEHIPELITQSVFEHLELMHRGHVWDDAPSLPDIPFVGGHVGYFGYELKSLTCGVPSPVPRHPSAAFMFCTRFLAFDHDLGRIHAIALHTTDGKDGAEDWVEKILAQLENLPKAAPVASAAPPQKVTFRLRHSRSAYLEKIDHCLAEIAKGETYEVCLTNQISGSHEVDALDLYRVLRRRNPAPYAAFLRMGDLAVACSSPERFLRIDRAGWAESKPIKGTARRDPDPVLDAAIAEDLRLDEKSRSENLMIVDLMRNDLGRVCKAGTVHVPSLMHIETYRTVHQLVSVIRGQLADGESAMRCIAACFPGGSMTGAPKIRTLKLIDELEGAARDIYSGALGFLSLSGEVDLNIVIRTIVCSPDGVSIGCGGAIVALSDPQAEFDEILLKASAPLSAIAETLTGRADAAYTVEGAEGEPLSVLPQTSHRLRMARTGDEMLLAQAVQSLLTELGGPGPQFTLKGAERAAGGLISNPASGFALIIEDSQAVEVVGIVTVSAVHAVRAGGYYGVLQELWVAPGYRSADHGARLLHAVEKEASRRGWPMVEVSLPLSGYAELPKLTKFYERAGYGQAGMRWRRRL